MKRILGSVIVAGITAAALVGCGLNPPEVLELRATTEGGNATVIVQTDGVSTTIPLEDGEPFSYVIDPVEDHDIAISVTADSDNPEHKVSCQMLGDGEPASYIENTGGGGSVDCTFDW